MEPTKKENGTQTTATMPKTLRARLVLRCPHKITPQDKEPAAAGTIVAEVTACGTISPRALDKALAAGVVRVSL